MRRHRSCSTHVTRPFLEREHVRNRTSPPHAPPERRTVAGARQPAGRVRAGTARGFPGVAGGAFRLSFGDASPQLSRVARWANIRAERTGILYGDQGIFVRSSAFRDLGGFPEEPLMEDLAFVRALRRTGTFTVLPDAVETSGRRYERNGVLKTCLLHQILLAAWLLGVPAETLARWRKRLSRR